jgi:hypothetical protein
MATTKTTVITKAGGAETHVVFTDAVGQIIDGCLVVTSQNVTMLYAPGQWLRAWTEKIDASAS